MLIGVISDTHVRSFNSKELQSNRIVRLINEIFYDVDIILHAGDFTDIRLLEQLRKDYTIYAVHGNMDSIETRSLLPFKQQIECENKLIGLIHGWGAPLGLWKRVRDQFDVNIDCIVFGHSHRYFNQRKDDILFFNPGSPTLPLIPGTSSVGLLEVSSAKIEGKIIFC